MGACSFLYHEGAKRILRDRVVLRCTSKIDPFVRFVTAENQARLSFVRELEITIYPSPYLNLDMNPVAFSRLVDCLRGMSRLSYLLVAHAEQLLAYHPPIADAISGLENIEELVCQDTGPKTVEMAKQLRSQIVRTKVGSYLILLSDVDIAGFLQAPAFRSLRDLKIDQLLRYYEIAERVELDRHRQKNIKHQATHGSWRLGSLAGSLVSLYALGHLYHVPDLEFTDYLGFAPERGLLGHELSMLSAVLLDAKPQCLHLRIYERQPQALGYEGAAGILLGEGTSELTSLTLKVGLWSDLWNLDFYAIFEPIFTSVCSRNIGLLRFEITGEEGVAIVASLDPTLKPPCKPWNVLQDILEGADAGSNPKFVEAFARYILEKIPSIETLVLKFGPGYAEETDVLQMVAHRCGTHVAFTSLDPIPVIDC